MRIVFMGTPDFAIPSLRMLVENGYEVVGVITAPDRPAGRGKKLRPSPVKVYAQEQGLTILQPEKLRNPDFIAALTSLQPDLAVVVAFRMLPKMVWSIPPQGTLNLHAALLPDYRGAAPLNWVIINGETKTGATTFLIDKKIDTGAMLLQTELDIPPEWNAGDLHDAMMETGADLVLQTVQAIDQGTVTPQAQDHTGFVHPAPKIFKENCRINWDQDVETIHNFVRGLSPYPTAWTRLNDKLLKIFAGRPNYNSEDSDPGALRVEDNRLFVAVRKAWWEVLELQLEGKKRMDTGTFLRGYKEELQHVE
ncbi:MAG: methionyl-tRNA formyltransferase [Bacteroidota bacterium]